MTIDWWTLVFQTVNFLVLVWILARYLFRPVSRIIAERQAAAHAALDEAEAARDEARAAREAAADQTAEIAAQRAVLIARATEEAGSERQRLMDAAHKAAEKARSEGLADLKKLHEKERRALADEAGTLATDIAARLLARLPEQARTAGFIDGLAEAVAKLPETTRNQIGVDGPVRLRVARDLTGDESDHLTARLGDVLARPVELDATTDDTLIAGLELETPHAIVRNSFRADLDRIRQELSNHG